jgi:hypothetical protein
MFTLSESGLSLSLSLAMSSLCQLRSLYPSIVPISRVSLSLTLNATRDASIVNKTLWGS